MADAAKFINARRGAVAHYAERGLVTEGVGVVVELRVVDAVRVLIDPAVRRDAQHVCSGHADSLAHRVRGIMHGRRAGDFDKIFRRGAGRDDAARVDARDIPVVIITGLHEGDIAKKSFAVLFARPTHVRIIITRLAHLIDFFCLLDGAHERLRLLNRSRTGHCRVNVFTRAQRLYRLRSVHPVLRE